MTLPWSKLPRVLAGDPRVTLLSPEGACAYLAARLLADDHGSVGCVGGRDAAGTLAAVVAKHRAGDSEWARRAVDECVEAGLLDPCDDGTVLRVVDWLADGAPVPVAAAADAPAHRAPGRPLKGSAPMPARERRVRSAFRNREWVEFRGVAKGVTWEQWTAEHPAARTKLLRVANETPERNPVLRTKLPNETTERNSPSGRAASGTSEFSGTQKDEEYRGKSESPDARAGERDSRTRPANETPVANETRASASVRTVVELAPFAADVLLQRMSTASGGRIAAASTSTHMRDFGTVARDLIANGHATPDALVKAGGHAQHVAWICQLKSPLTVERLYAAGGKILVELLTSCATCAECGGSPLELRVVPPADDESSAFDAEIDARRRAYHATPIEEGAIG